MVTKEKDLLACGHKTSLESLHVFFFLNKNKTEINVTSDEVMQY